MKCCKVSGFSTQSWQVGSMAFWLNVSPVDCSIYVPVNIFIFIGILAIALKDDSEYNSGCIFPGAQLFVEILQRFIHVC